MEMKISPWLRQYQAGITAAEKNEYIKAIQLFSDALPNAYLDQKYGMSISFGDDKLYKGNIVARTLANRSSAYLNAGLHKEGLQDANLLLEELPGSSYGLYLKAYAYYQMQMYEDAEKWIDKSLAIEQTYDRLQIKASILNLTQQGAKLEALAEQAIQLYPDSSFFSNALARMYGANWNETKACAYASKALRQDSSISNLSVYRHYCGCQVSEISVRSGIITQTNIQVNPGDVIELRASGTIVLGPFVGSTGPMGIRGYQNYNIVRGANHGQLVGNIAGNGWFGLEDQIEFSSKWSGTLSLQVNDRDPDNNRGAFSVKVRAYTPYEP